MEHPIIKNMMMTGDPNGITHEPVAVDINGEDIYRGELVYELLGDLYIAETLSSDAIDILDKIGADRFRL